ncbi:MAG: TetR/AcrR family transcriptional regulator [Pseudomonadota bacterium]
MEQNSRDKLAWTAARLFQERGFHGVGLNEILAASKLPKGSLYHHFPNGKSDLALEAAALAHREMSRIIDDAFEHAESYRSGATTLFYKLAKLFELMGKHTGCPISVILFSGPENDMFRERCAEYFASWTQQIASHAERLGESSNDAQLLAKKMFVTLQGGWTLARATQDGDVLRDLTKLLFNDKCEH